MLAHLVVNIKNLYSRGGKKKSILQYIVVLSVAINNRYTDGKYRYFITTHIMDLPRCHRQYLISPVLFVGALIP